ncbi:MAG: monovalent cation/H(+) antiporter subunit G [Clostridium sp.]
MSTIVDIFILILLLCGLILTFSGFIGIFRLKDTMSRLQASTNITTLGVIFIILGAIIYGLKFSLAAFAIKGILIIIFILITGPIAAHTMARSYHKLTGTGELKRDDYWRDMYE